VRPVGASPASETARIPGAASPSSRGALPASCCRVYGKRHGFGAYTYLDGGSYSGEWVDDRIQGQGTCVFANKNSYTGAWEDGRISGFGTLTYADGDKVGMGPAAGVQTRRFVRVPGARPPPATLPN
jgi:hypothetical protein